MIHSARTAIVCLALLAATAGTAHAQANTTWYLAEGATGMFEEEILIGNPNASSTSVTIQYILPGGAGPTRVVNVPATSRVTVRVNDDVPSSSVSAVVTSALPVVVERSMYWGGARRAGGHNTFGVQQPATDWFLAEGVSNAIFDEFILIANPNQNAVEVEIAYLGTDGVRDIDTYVVPAVSRRTIWAAVDLETRFAGRFRNRTFSARVRSTSGGPIIVERAIYWGGIFAAGLNPGGTNAAGITQLSTTWRFAEGFAEGRRAGGFLTFLLLANPGDTAAEVRTTFLLEDGTTEVDTRTVAPNSRTNIWVNEETARASSRPFSILVESTNGVPVAAERAMYWGGLREGHVTAGVTEEATAWAFADGQVDRHGGIQYDTYFLLANSTSNPATVTATFMREDGTGFQDTFTVNPTSRYTLIANRYPQLSNQKFATFLTSDVPIVAERAMYWGAGYYGGHASAGLPWTGPAPAVPPAPAPATVTGISPAYGPTTGDTQVIITGTNFAQGATVRFGTSAAAAVQVLDATSIRAWTPANSLGAKAVTVTSNGVTATSPQDFTYEAPPPPPPPPTSGTVARGTASTLNGTAVIEQLALQRPDLLFGSCTEHGGNNEFMVEAVRRLRAATGTNRWGMNWKRGVVGDLSQDIVTYFYGPEGTEMQNDTRVYIFDIIGGHCGSRPYPTWIDQTQATRNAGTIGRWTTAGRNF